MLTAIALSIVLSSFIPSNFEDSHSASDGNGFVSDAPNDGTKDGQAGYYTTDNTSWINYEFKKPLCSGDQYDFCLVL